MKIIQQIINAVTVIPVKMYQTISKHIMFRCHCRFLLGFDFLSFCLADVGIANKYARESFQLQQIQLLCDHQELACTPKDPPRRVNMKGMSFRNVYRTNY